MKQALVGQSQSLLLFAAGLIVVASATCLFACDDAVPRCPVDHSKRPPSMNTVSSIFRAGLAPTPTPACSRHRIFAKAMMRRGLAANSPGDAHARRSNG